MVCALRPAGKAFYFWGDIQRLKGPYISNFSVIVGQGFLFFFYLEANYNLGAAALKVKNIYAHADHAL